MAELPTVTVPKSTDMVLLGPAIVTKVKVELATITVAKSPEMVLLGAHVILLATTTIN
jgi:hypothetical protein